MPAKDERRELVPAIIATIVAGIGAFFFSCGLTSETMRGRGDGMITSAVCCDVDPDELSAAEPDDDEGIEQVETDGRNNY